MMLSLLTPYWILFFVLKGLARFSEVLGDVIFILDSRIFLEGFKYSRK